MIKPANNNINDVRYWGDLNAKMCACGMIPRNIEQFING